MENRAQSAGSFCRICAINVIWAINVIITVTKYKSGMLTARRNNRSDGALYEFVDDMLSGTIAVIAVARNNIDDNMSNIVTTYDGYKTTPIRPIPI